jgi:hypothetical protein
VAAWFPDLFCNQYLVKNHKIAKNSTTAKARFEKISSDMDFFGILEFFKCMFD